MYSVTILFLSVLPTFMLFTLARFERKKNVPSPLLILAWTFLLGYTMKGVYLVYTLHSDLGHRLDYFGDNDLDLGGMATVYGVFAFLAGYLLVSGKYVTPGLPSVRLPAQLSALSYFGLFVISLSLMMIFFWKMGFVGQVTSLSFVATKFLVLEQGKFATSLGFLTMGGDFLLIFALYYFLFTKKIRLLNVYTLTLLFLFLCYFLASRRGAALIIIIAILMTVGIRNASQNVGNRFSRAIWVGCAVLTLSFASQIRSGGETSLADLDVRMAVETTVEHTLRGAYFMDPSKTAAIITETSQRDLFQYGTSYFAVVFAPVPRILWPEKPAIRVSKFVGQDVLDFRNNSGAPPGGIAELYLNFGWLGIGLGMTLVGAVNRLCYNGYVATPDRRFARIPYVIIMLCTVMFFVADFAMALLYFIRYAIAMLVCHHYWSSVVQAAPESVYALPSPRNSSH